MSDTTDGGIQVPTIDDDPNIPRDVLRVVTDMEPSLVYKFSTTTERDATFSAVAFKECWVGDTKYLRIGSAWAAVAPTKTRGPSTVKDYSGPEIVIQVTAQITLGRVYEVTGQFLGQQLTVAGKPTVYISSSSTVAGRLVSLVDGHDTYAALDTCSASGSYMWTGPTGSQLFTLIASTSAGALRLGSNTASLWVKDIGAS